MGELHATLGELSSDVSKGRGEACGVWPNTEPPHPATHQAPLVWRAPEGPEGTGGLRGAALNEVRPPSLADSRALRRPEHPWGHKQRRPIGGRREAWPGHSQRRPIGGRREACGAWLRCPWAVAGPGRASRRRAERSSRRGRLAGGPPPTGTQSSPAPQSTRGCRKSDGDAIRQKSGGPQENLGTTTRAFTDVN